METTTLIYLALGTLVFAFLLGWYMKVQGRKELEAEQRVVQAEAAITAAHPKPFGSTNPEIRRLQLQAYERLVLLAERIALPNLISRLNQPGISAINTPASPAGICTLTRSCTNSFQDLKPAP